jgi:hypothetical protein
MIAVFCYRISVSYGEMAGKSCLYAIILNFLAVIISRFPTIIMSGVQPAKIITAFFMGTAIRLFIVLGGSILVLYLLKIDVLWFVGWLVFFYLTVLAVETYYSVLFLRRFDPRENRQDDE